MMSFVDDVSSRHARDPNTRPLHSELAEREQDQVVAARRAVL